MPKIIHQDLIGLSRLFDFSNTGSGICRGFSGMWAQAVMGKEEQKFYQRLELIASYKGNYGQLKKDIDEVLIKAKNKETLEESSLQLLEVLVFFSGMDLYLNPQFHRDFFNSRSTKQIDLDLIYSFAQSTALEKTKLAILLNKQFAFDKKQLSSYFEKLAEILQDASYEYPILLGNSEHSVSLKYDSGKKIWCYLDTNDFERYPQHSLYYRELSLSDLVDSVFVSLNGQPDQVVFSTVIMATESPDIGPIKSKLEDIDAQFPITPSMASMVNNNGIGLLDLICMNGRVDSLRILLTSEIDINRAINKFRMTALYTACHYGQIEMVRELLKQPGIDLNKPTKTGETPLEVACREGYVEVVRELLQHHDSLQINHRNKMGETALYVASSLGYLDIVQELLGHKGIDINIDTHAHETPIFAAFQNGHMDSGYELIQQKGIDIQSSQFRAKTLLHLACQLNKVDLVQTILKIDNSNINQETAFDETALSIACHFGFLEIVLILLEQTNIEVNKGVKSISIDFSAAVLDVEEAGIIDPSSMKNEAFEESLLYIACSRGQYEIARALAKHKAINLNAGRKRVGSSLSSQNVHNLSEQSSDLEEITPLQILCSAASPDELLMQLLTTPQTISYSNRSGFKALDYAIEQKNAKILSFLYNFAKNAEIPAQNLMSAYSLEKASLWAQQDCPENIDYLLGKGALLYPLKQGASPGLFARTSPANLAASEYEFCNVTMKST